MKNTLKVIGALVVFILGIIIIDAVFVKDEKEKVSNENIDFQLSFLISDVIGEYELVEFNEEEKQIISELLQDLDYTSINVDLAFSGDYKLVFDEKELIFSNNDDPYGQIIMNDKMFIIDIKELKETLLKYIESKNLLRVYLFSKDYTTDLYFTRITLDNNDKLVLKESFKNIRSLEEYEITNLAIVGKYYLIVDSEIVYFDDLDGYAMYNDEMVMLDSDTINVLKKYIVTFSNKECCTCCPDAEPGEVCITACCSCQN